jgi:hypothetical protein
MTRPAALRRPNPAESAGMRPAVRRRMGLALAGGGPLGGIYEIGALLALAEALDGVDLNALDVYVGVSSGSFVAAALANGISPSQMYRLFIDDGSAAALSPGLFLRPAIGEFARRALTVPGLRPRGIGSAIRDLEYALDHLEVWLAGGRRGTGRPRLQRQAR